MSQDLRNCRGRPVNVALKQADGVQSAVFYKRNSATIVRLDSCVLRLMCRDYFIRREVSKAQPEPDMEKACANPTKYPTNVLESELLADPVTD